MFIFRLIRRVNAYVRTGTPYHKIGYFAFTKKAAKEARKAAAVDASVRRTAKKTAVSYEGRAPSKTDIFTEGRSGQTISIKCWIGKSITVPSL